MKVLKANLIEKRIQNPESISCLRDNLFDSKIPLIAQAHLSANMYKDLHFPEHGFKARCYVNTSQI